MKMTYTARQLIFFALDLVIKSDRRQFSPDILIQSFEKFWYDKKILAIKKNLEVEKILEILKNFLKF